MRPCTLSPLLLSTVLFVGSCTSGAPDYDLSRSDRSADAERMNRRMNVRLYRENASREIEDYDEVSGNAPMTAVELAGHVGADRCALSSFGDALGVINACAEPGLGACATATCNAQMELCVAEEVLSLAALPAPEVVTIPGEGDWLLPAQSAATKSALAREAYRRAGRALVSAAQALHRGMDGSCTPALSGDFDTVEVEGATPPSVTRSQGEAAAASFLSALSALDEALDLTHRSVTAVADAQLSDEASIEDATRLASTLEVGSRSELAHLNVGGFRSGLQGGLPALRKIDQEGFCPEPRLSPQARQALELFRTAAVPPREILDEDKDIEAILVDWDPGAAIDGLLPRLAILLSAPHLHPMNPSSISLQEFYDGWGLDARAFEDARAHLANEIRAFGRPLDMLLPPQQVTPSVQTTFPLYAATRTPPEQPLQAYWAAVAGYEFDNWQWPNGAHPVVGMPELNGYAGALDCSSPPCYSADDPGYNVLIDAAATNANRLVASTAAGLDDARQLLGAHVASIAARRPGRIEYCWHDGAGVALRTRVYLDRPYGAVTEAGSEIALVAGLEGLDCAVRGHVSGAECDLDDYRLTELSESTPPLMTAMGSLWQNNVSVSELDQILDLENPIYYDPAGNPVAQVYVIERRGTRWAPLGGALIRIPTEGTAGGYECETVPIVPDADANARDALAPNTAYCAMSGGCPGRC